MLDHLIYRSEGCGSCLFVATALLRFVTSPWKLGAINHGRGFGGGVVGVQQGVRVGEIRTVHVQAGSSGAWAQTNALGRLEAWSLRKSAQRW